MTPRILIVTAVQGEADAIGNPNDTFIVSGGIGRTNAAVSTTTSILSNGPFSWVISAGIAGALPESNLQIGDIVIANKCVYAEEGLQTPDGFQNMQEMGFSLGDFDGNDVPVDQDMLERIGKIGVIGSIATVATCSGTDRHAKLLERRTQCVCEAMEGAAVVHTARKFGLQAIEIRAISNTTGDRNSQEWDLALALKNLGSSVNKAITALRAQ
jgi:futalosine hydrolase